MIIMRLSLVLLILLSLISSSVTNFVRSDTAVVFTDVKLDDKTAILALLKAGYKKIIIVLNGGLHSWRNELSLSLLNLLNLLVLMLLLIVVKVMHLLIKV